MRIAALPRGVRARIAFWALAGVALLVSHDAIFLAQLGPGEQLVRTLRHAAHDYWGAASLALTVAGVGVGLAIAIRIVRLQRRAATLGARPRTTGRARYLRRVLSTWLALFAVVALGFLAQENLEHARAHGHLPGVGALIGPDYPLAVPVIGLITLAGALLGAALGGAERALLVAITEALAQLVLRPPSRLVRPPARLTSPRWSPLAGSSAERAPPRRLASIIWKSEPYSGAPAPREKHHGSTYWTACRPGCRADDAHQHRRCARPRVPRHRRHQHVRGIHRRAGLQRAEERPRAPSHP